jgi:hypothetical protein
MFGTEADSMCELERPHSISRKPRNNALDVLVSLPYFTAREFRGPHGTRLDRC